MNVEDVIVVLMLLGLGVLIVPWLVRLSLSTRGFRIFSLKILRSRPIKQVRSYLGSRRHFRDDDAQLNSQQGESASERQLQVRYLSPDISHSPLRLVPWDARGVLRETERGFSFRGNDITGDFLSLEFPSDEVQINYQKGNLLWDGGFSWCVIERDGEKHFFTSDLEDTAPKSERDSSQENMSATGIYQSITKRYI